MKEYILASVQDFGFNDGERTWAPSKIEMSESGLRLAKELELYFCEIQEILENLLSS